MRRSDLDKRCQSISVTEAGAASGEQITANRVRTEGLLLSGMTENGKAQFVHLLQAAYETVKNDGDEGGEHR